MVGIICEFNPFHRGHKFIIDTAGEMGPVVLIMSGNFTQRGSAAVFDKYTRAAAAVMSGADLVLELPFPWCSAGGAEFAAAGVEIAKKIGVHSLVFGSGSGDGDALRRAGEAFAGMGGGMDFDTRLAAAAKEDPEESAARLRQKILADVLSPETADSLSNPNDILGIEYYRNAILRGGIECIPVKRCEGECVVSATSIRRMMEEGRWEEAKAFIPESAHGVFDLAVSEECTVSENSLLDVIRVLFRTDSVDFDRAAECGGGVGRRLRRAAATGRDGAEMLRLASTKKYTDTRLRRAALFAATGILWEDIKSDPFYTTVLAVGERGAKLLREIKARGDIQVLTKAAHHGKLSPKAGEQFARSARADRLYTMLMKAPKREDHFLGVTPYVAKY